MSNIPKNLIAAIGFSAPFFNFASGDSLQDQVDTQRDDIFSLDRRIENIVSPSAVAIAGVSLGVLGTLTAYCVCFCSKNKYEKISDHTISINNLSITNRENQTKIEILTQRIDKLEQGLNAK